MPDEYVNVSVTVAADGSVVETTYAQEHVADIRVQPFGSGSYDVAFITTVEVSPRSVAEATTEGGCASVKGLYCNFSPANPKYAYQVTVRVQTSRGQEAESTDSGFRLDLQLA
ncbi:hypothetical protein ACQP1G_12895 [Nocardia sp. CA-107356]|uniref:hypothetical protein n=1 Tax=Nocardia sp. CA-107356 TaxID=3239972 RepID=UPI003D8C96DF